jgi:hypothetical protein
LTNRRKRSPFDNYRLKISTRIYELELRRDFEEIVDSTVSSPDEYKKLLEFYTEYRLEGRPEDQAISEALRRLERYRERTSSLRGSWKSLLYERLEERLRSYLEWAGFPGLIASPTAKLARHIAKYGLGGDCDAIAKLAIAKGLEGVTTTVRTQDGREVKVPLSAAFVKFFCRDKAREAYEKALKEVYGKEVDASEIFAALPNPW